MERQRPTGPAAQTNSGDGKLLREREGKAPSGQGAREPRTLLRGWPLLLQPGIWSEPGAVP